jgi:hypothetical protein
LKNCLKTIFIHCSTFFKNYIYRGDFPCAGGESCFHYKGQPVESGSPLGWPAWGGQLGLAAVSFFIVCPNKGQFFLSLFSPISMNFFEFLSSNYHGEGEKVGWPALGGQLGLAAVSLLHILS